MESISNINSFEPFTQLFSTYKNGLHLLIVLWLPLITPNSIPSTSILINFGHGNINESIVINGKTVFDVLFQDEQSFSLPQKGIYILQLSNVQGQQYEVKLAL